MFSLPARCPAWRERPRCCAQRPLPSMITATCRGSGAIAGSVSASASGRGRATAGRAVGARWPMLTSLDLHQLRLFLLARPVHVGDELVGELLELVVAAAHLIFGRVVRALLLAQLVVAVAADVA